MNRTDLVGSTVTKTAPATITKVINGDELDDPGGFEALVAIFGNVDSQGDVVIAGAFADSIAEHSGTYPSVWAHQVYDESAIIASATAKETDDGLLWTATFLPTPRAQNIRMLMEAGLITEFSWSGNVVEGSWIDKQGEGVWGDGFYEIRKVDLWEAGPCFKGANSETELLEVKSVIGRLTTKEGRILAQTHVDTLKSIRESLDGVIVAVEKVGDDEEKSVSDTYTSGETVTVSPITRARLALS